MPRVAATVSVAAVLDALDTLHGEFLQRANDPGLSERIRFGWDCRSAGLTEAQEVVRSVASRPARAPKKPAAKRGRGKQ
jgi:hypothetical protein